MDYDGPARDGHNGVAGGKKEKQPVNAQTGKQIGLLAVFVALLALLGWGINHFGNADVTQSQAAPQPASKMDAAKIAAEWPQIVAHAAAPPRGRSDTRYTLAEFGDFQCPQCGKARPILEKMLALHPAQVNLIFLHRPFPTIHQYAVAAGKASVIAAAQGKFWPMYDVLYSHQDDLEPGFYPQYAADAGLNVAQFKAAQAAGEGQKAVQDASAFADSLNVQETPTVLLYDSQKKTVIIYVGMAGTKNADGSVQYPGISSLVNSPLWAAKTR